MGNKVELSRVKYAALSITHNCNLRCKYCYAEEKINKKMDIETAKKSIDFLVKNSNKRCIVTFFGGEPLVEFKLIKKIVDYSHQKYEKKVEFRMSTNGTLLNRKILQFLKDNKIYFVLSIDGNKEQHDYNRKFKDNKGSYESIIEKLENIFEVNPYTIAVSVVVPETAQFLFSGVENLFSKGFRYVLQTLNYSAQWEKKHIKILKEQYTKISQFYYKNMMNNKKIYYSPFDERIKTWAQKPYEKGDLCDLANTQIAIAPSGRIYPCVQFIGTDSKEYQKNAIGNVFSGFDEKKRRYYVEKNYLEKESCKGCALNGRCTTFCGCVNWRATGSLLTIPPIICEHERMLLPIVDKLANRLWKKNNLLFKRKFYERTFPVSSYIEDCLMKEVPPNVKNKKD